jgi:hypothetical protein
MVVTKVCLNMCGRIRGHVDSGRLRQVFEAAGRRVAVHPDAEGVAQDRPGVAAVNRAVDGPSHRRRQRGKHHLAALAPHPQHAVAVFLAQVADARAAGFKDPQSEQAQERDQREVVRVGRQPGGGD